MWIEAQATRDLFLMVLVILVQSATGIWLATAVATVVWPRSSAAMRHRLWGLSMLAVLCCPILVLELPVPRVMNWKPLSESQIPTTSSQDLLTNENINASEASDSFVVSQEMPTEAKFADPGVSSTPEKSKFTITSVNPILNFVVWTWLAGATLSGLLILTSFRRSSILIRHGLPMVFRSYVDRCATICRQLSITRPIQIVVSPEVIVPSVTGVRRPVILLPTGFGQWSQERVDVVLAHELMHVKRSDLLWQLVARMCLVPMWFHPLGWLAYKRLRIECEHACDDAVLLNGESPTDYANHLVELATWCQHRSMPSLLQSVAIVGNGSVEKRVRSILNPTIARHPLNRWRASCAVIGMAAIVFTIVVVSPSISESKPPVTIEHVFTLDASEQVRDEQIEKAVTFEEDHFKNTVIDPAGTAKSSDETRPVNDEIPMTRSDPFVALFERAIDITSRRTLNANAHSPWQILHCILAMRQNAVLKLGNEKVNAIHWLSTTEPQFDHQPWLLLTPDGAKFHSYTRVYAFEGHPAQFLALLTHSNLPLDHEFHVQGKIVTLNDLVNNTMKEVNSKEEVTWVLWALQHYLKPDATWINRFDEAWSIERLVQIESNAPTSGAPCGGSEGLFALTRARDKYLRIGGTLRGVWYQADSKIKKHIQVARSLQNADGSFSSDWYRGPGHTTDVNRRFNTTGHTMEFLAIALPDEQLDEAWVRNAVSMLSKELIEHRDHKIDCAALFQSLDALILYRHRIRALSR